MKTRLSIPRTISRLVRVRRATQISGLVIQSMPARYAELWPPTVESPAGQGPGGRDEAGERERGAGEDHGVNGGRGTTRLRRAGRGPEVEPECWDGHQGRHP